MTRSLRFILLPFACMMGLMLSNCTAMSGAVMEGATDSQAAGKILRVSAQPVTFGYQRLGYHSDAFPAVGQFLKTKGYPDYLIEESGFTSRQMVMFYLKPNQAYLFQMKEGLSGPSLKVTGPEPIGKKTRAIFDAIGQKTKADR